MPAGPSSGDAINPVGARPRARADVGRALEDLAMHGRVAHDATLGPAAAGLELGLDERDDVAALLGEAGDDRRQHQVQRDERDVDDREA